MNHDSLRKLLWPDLVGLSQNIEEAWCVMGHFNSVLYPGERIRGIEVNDRELIDFVDCLV